MVWRAIVRSSVGTSHKKRQMPCQDYGQYIIATDDIIVGAVADGAGSAKYSDIGAELAVKTCLLNLGEWLESQKHLSPLSEQQAATVFSWTLETVVTVLKQQAANSGYPLNELACTLIVFIAAPDWVAAMQVGDGFLVAGSQIHEYHLLFQPTKGEFINETTFVTAPSALEEMQVCVRPGHQAFICASTDGLERVAIRMDDWLPFARFFQPLQDYMWATSSPEQEDEYIRNFLDSERLNARTDDDKTILLCVYGQ